MPHPGLIEWVAKQHVGQLIKLTTEPYLNHLVRVAEMAGQYAASGYECGLCHDLLEKTRVTPQLLSYHLRQCGYVETAADLIVTVAVELTDVYTKLKFPDLKKSERKEREAHRLETVSPTAQTVKYADLYDNIQWMLQHDPSQALSYLQRKKDLVLKMNAGNPDLRRQLLDYITLKLL
jgi:(p)ppGpp synthase/HD superfamily hydrolase